MNQTGALILTLNGGSSSIRFALYRLDDTLERQVHGKIERIGFEHPILSTTSVTGQRQLLGCPAASDYPSAAKALLDWLDTQESVQAIVAIGHRVVHGMNHQEPEIITPVLLDELRHFEVADPEHLPGAVALIEICQSRRPAIAQVACFDTAFHRQMPRVAKMLAVPRRLEAIGVQRYGFHGLSYAYLMEELARSADSSATKGRVILAHLGNGASMAAVQNGRSMDTSMGFTPASGLLMGTRSGDLDPGLALFLSRTEQMTGAQFDDMVNRQSGLLGISQTSSDMRDLLEREVSDVRAGEAVALFCYTAKKCLGAYAAALGGLDTLVFAGGIGESAPLVRTRICEGLGFLGIELDSSRNGHNSAVISSAASRVSVRVIRTDEELMIARSVCRVLELMPS